MKKIRDQIKKLHPDTFFFIMILPLVFILFFDFFTKGYVMDGAYDRRNNILPFYSLFIRAFQNFDVPQWNPFLFCGNNLLSHSGYVLFYPFNWIIWISSENSVAFVTTVVLLIHFIAAGYFMWRFLQTLVKDNFWAICGAAAYMFSSSLMMSLFTNTEQFLVFVYGPALFYLVETCRNRSITASYILQTSVISLLLLGGSVQFILYLSGFLLAFIFSRLVTEEMVYVKNTLRALIVSLCSVVSAALIAAVRWVPFYLGTSGNSSIRQSYEDFLRINSTPPESIMKLFLPEFFPYLNKGEYFNSYAGVCMAFLALYALAFIWERRSWFWKIMMVGIPLMVVGTPVAYIHYYLTGKSNLAFGRMAVLVPFSLLTLMGLAGKLILEDRRHLRRFLLFSTTLSLLILSVATVLYNYYPDQTDWNRYNVMRIEMRNAMIFFGLNAVLSIGLFGYYYKSLSDSRAQIFKAALFCIIVADVFVVAKTDVNSQNPSFIPEPFYRSSPQEKIIADMFVREGRNFRMLGMGEGTSYNRSIRLDLYNSSGYESIPPAYITALYAYPAAITRSSPIYRHIAPDMSPYWQRVMELTSTRFIVNDNYTDEIQTVLPRYSLFNNYVVIGDDRDALKTLLDANYGFNIRKTVVLSAPPDITIPSVHEQGGVKVLDERSDSLLFEVISPFNTVLLINDTYDEGWKAYLDGTMTKLIRANYAFRAVAVPAGRHKVKLLFTQNGFTAGAITSVVGLTMFFAVVIVHMRRRVGPLTNADKTS